MNIHAAAVLFVIGCTTSSIFSSDVAGRHRQALQSKKASVGGNSDIDRCIDGFTGTYTYTSECNGVAFMASLGCDANQFCTYTESQFADMTVSVCPNRGPRPPSDCVLSGSFAATKHVDPKTCEVKVFKLSGDNCNFQEFAATPTGIRITQNKFNDDESIGIYFERMDNDPKILSSTKDDLNARRLDKKSVGVLYSKSVDDHHRYLANGDVTTEDKMKVLDVHRRRLECSGDDCDVDSIATCNPKNDCACAPTNGWCRSIALYTFSCPQEFRLGLWARTCDCNDPDLGPNYKDCLNWNEPACVDKDERCKEWAGRDPSWLRSECETNPDYMLRNCRRSCNFYRDCDPPDFECGEMKTSITCIERKYKGTPCKWSVEFNGFCFSDF